MPTPGARRGAMRGATTSRSPEQDTALWHADLIAEAEALLRTAGARGSLGRYQLEAAIQSAHVVRRLTGRADWDAIELLYGALAALTGSPVVAINRAVAIAETRGPAAGLAALDALKDDTQLVGLSALLGGAGRIAGPDRRAAEAEQAYELAIGLESDPAVRRFLQQQREQLEA